MIAAIQNGNPEQLILKGYTDSIGNTDYNQYLSLQRALAARDYLVNKGIESDHIEVHALGEQKPLVDNADAQQRRFNRRVEIEGEAAK